ncbi:hypothetical protein [Hymenobacter latericus]|uniref:hypothetical protein n=1 Tax=Hymenobacter sp. YIM 151858-1 TaxID=2987688 RepID=UPI002225CC68|nr:hypothetical protein [Hymenobacter sp. YIM 151858-1]UYZ60086.1 hypothetical protein OIS50_04620 [Hymenobacter sp. YIM 151858-1]
MAEDTYAHRFRYDITQLRKGETVLERWPELAAANDKLITYGAGENDPFLRYAIYLGEGSGLHTAGLDWHERKKEALRLAGIPADHPRVEKILNLTDDPTRELRWAWLRVTSSRLFRSYVAGCEAYDQTCERVEKRIAEEEDAADKGDLKADAEMRANRSRIDLWLDLDRMEVKLKEMEARLFFDDEDMKKQAAEEAKPQAARDSWENQVLSRKKKK